MNRTPIRRGKPLPRKNAKRRKSEFARCYHSKERVEFVKSLPCAARNGLIDCCIGQVENAHIKTDGLGRKADADKIVPLCSRHHRDYDEHAGIFAGKSFRADMQWVADQVERLWSEWQTRGGQE